ncbi:TetR/AcrR family transcriptional regulator [Rhodospirillum sp. A1_3_36]|uniref:TetR/AcrR family transcriptional regulator n=1 Tax=Rhodospirillum sp. A1_3_36 TaxID=3391666 RepID=UPI0039A68FF8
MNGKGTRPGGRSARVQSAVHEAVTTLLREHERSDLTVPQVAERAGVTPSTIYRRWGDLRNLLADVAEDRLRPDADPEDTGSLRSDLEAWLIPYAEELASEPGRQLIRDSLFGARPPGAACKCDQYLRELMTRIVIRSKSRDEPTPDVDALIDGLVAPLLYRITFAGEHPDTTYCRSLIDNLLSRDKTRAVQQARSL